MKNINLDEVLKTADKLPTKYYANRIREMIAAGVEFPITEVEALRIRNAGKRTFLVLQQLGLIKPRDTTWDGCPVSMPLIIDGHVIAETKADLKDAVEFGDIYPGSMRGYGWVKHQELCSYLGLSIPKKPVQKLICPCCKKKFIFDKSMIIREP